MDILVSLDEDTDKRPDRGELVTTDQAVSVTPPDPKKVEEDAWKAHFGLNEESPGVDQIQTALLSGRERDFREQAALSRDVLKQRQKIRMIEDMASQEVITDDDISLLEGLTTINPADPDTILETSFANTFINTAMTRNEDSSGVFNEALATDPERTLDMSNAARDVLARQQIAARKYQELEDRWKDTGWGTYISDWAEQIVPFLSWHRISQAGEGIEIETVGTGGMIREIAEYGALLPPEEFSRWVNETADTIADKSVLDAMKFVTAVQSYTVSDEYLDNWVFVAEVLDVASLGLIPFLRGGAAAGRAARGAARGAAEGLADGAVLARAKEALKSTVSAGSISVRKTDDILAAVGDINRAIDVGVAQRVLTVPQVGNTADDMARTLPTLFRMDAVANNPGALAREGVDRVVASLQRTGIIARDVLTDPMRNQRLTPEALQVAINVAKEDLKRDFRHLSDTVIDIRADVLDANLANTQTVSMKIGATNATAFPTEDLATFFGEHIYGLPDFRVVQQGDGFLLQVTRNVDETADKVRAMQVATTIPEPRGMVENFIDILKAPGKMLPKSIRTVDETLSPFQNEQRKAAQFGYTRTLDLMKEIADSITTLPKAAKDDLSTVLKYNRDFYNSKTGQRGMFYETIGDLEDAYRSALGRLPNENEIEAYFKYVQMNNLDWVMRNAALYRDKARLGLKRYSFEFGEIGENGKLSFKSSPEFEGKEVSGIPWNSPQPAEIVLYDETAKTSVRIRSNDPQADTFKQFIKDNDYKIIQIDNPVSRPLKDVTKDNGIVNFLVVKNPNKQELAWKQLDYNPGGHVEYAHPWFVKQPKVLRGEGGVAYYEGDMTAFNFATRAEAQKYTKAMETARQLLKGGDEAALKSHLKGTLPYSVSQFKRLFKDKKLADGTMERATFDINQPFGTVQKGGKLSEEMDLKSKYPSFKDETSSSYSLSDEIDRSYVGARSGPLMTIKQAGDETNPVFNFTPAKLLDPIQTMGRALNNVAANRSLTDYKIGAVEDWIGKYGKALRVSEKELRANPMYHLHNPDWDLSAGKAVLIEEAATARSAILNIVGAQTAFGRRLENVKQRLYDQVFSSFGGKTSDKLTDLSPADLGAIRDPAAFFRSVAFQFKMGFFNPVQLWQQAHGMTHVMALSPVQGMKGAGAFFATRGVLINPTKENISYAAEKMARMGWKKEHFEESMEALLRSDWHKVGRETAWYNDLAEPVTFQQAESAPGKVKRFFLDKGPVFFAEGERMTRLTGWNTSYLEWRGANPNALLNRAAERQILQRADMLTVNMTRASNAMFQNGAVGSVATQFFSYHLRLWDQFMGKRLTPTEKARAFLTYSAMYGVPTAMGGAALYPFYDDIRGAALERGVQMDDAFVRTFMEGIPSLMAGMIIGEDFNFTQRYGPGGLTILHEVANGEKGMLEVLGGVSGTIMADMIGGASTVLDNSFQLFKENGTYEPVTQDILAIARNITTVNNSVKVLMAMNTGKYYSKNGTYLTDMDTPHAIWSAITGLDKLSFSDQMLMAASNRAQQDLVREVKTEFIKHYRRGLQERAAGNHEAADSYWKLARAAIIAGDIQANLHVQWVSEALNGFVSYADRAEQQFIDRAPQSQVRDRRDQQIRRKDQ